MADLDHRGVTVPYLRLTDRRASSTGDCGELWHLRISQPNVAHVPVAVMHSLEHFLLDNMRAACPGVMLAAPMGCNTGLYISALGTFDFGSMAALVRDALDAARAATTVPHADPVHCGWATNHSLAGAQDVAAFLLRERAHWADSGPDAREV